MYMSQTEHRFLACIGGLGNNFMHLACFYLYVLCYRIFENT